MVDFEVELCVLLLIEFVCSVIELFVFDLVGIVFNWIAELFLRRDLDIVLVCD